MLMLPYLLCYNKFILICVKLILIKKKYTPVINFLEFPTPISPVAGPGKI